MGPTVLLVESSAPELLRALREAVGNKFEIATIEPNKIMRGINPIAVMGAALMGLRSQANSGATMSLPSGFGEPSVGARLRYSPSLVTSDPRHCPARIGNAQRGWRAAARRRTYGELSRRRRRNAA